MGLCCKLMFLALAARFRGLSIPYQVIAGKRAVLRVTSAIPACSPEGSCQCCSGVAGLVLEYLDPDGGWLTTAAAAAVREQRHRPQQLVLQVGNQISSG